MALSGTTDLAGRMLDGRYLLRAPIGTGASGRVYEAHDVKLRRRVAVKVLHEALASDAGFLRRFQTEARVAASLHHPNIVTVHDWGADGDLPYMVLELLEGGSLRSMLDAGTTLTVAQAAHVGRDVARALDYAHRRGIIHRDVKPANLLFDEHGGVRIADFGLARALAEASWTEPAGALFGTARYASPEQALGTQLDARSDIYAFALVMVESVTGTIPFAADTTISMLSVRTQRPLVVDPRLGPLTAVLERCGRVDRDDRYPDAGTLVAALDDAIEALPPPAPLQLVGSRDGSDADPTRVVAEPRAVDSAIGVEGVIDLVDLAEDDAAHYGDSDDDAVRRRTPASALFDQDAWRSTPGVGADPTIAGDAFVVEAERDDPSVAPYEPGNGSVRSEPEVVPEAPLEPRYRGERRLVPYVVAFLVVAAIVGGAIFFANMKSAISGVLVGHYQGLDQAAAAAKAREQGFAVHLVDAHNAAVAGTVFDQVPKPGIKLGKGDALNLSVSLGPAKVQVPAVVGLTEAKAEQLLTSRGFVVSPSPTKVYDNTNKYAAGIVIHSPSDGQYLLPKSPVTFTVSLGHAPVQIPSSLQGVPYAQAKAQLANLSFNVVRAADQNSETIPAGDVKFVSPTGTQPYKSAVTVVVSKGPVYVAIPPVAGKGIDAACRAITNLGLQCSGSNYTPGATVKYSTPAAGKLVRLHTVVTLVF
ncbi:MAG TPA: protein kinase [Acidimicrobiia bacterium]|jgi:serine/threonine-protein kinase